MEKYGVQTWNTRDMESRELTYTKKPKDKLSTKNYLNQVLDIEEEEEDKTKCREDSSLEMALKKSEILNEENDQISDLDETLADEDIEIDMKPKCISYMKSGSELKNIISENSKQTEKFKTTISGNKTFNDETEDDLCEMIDNDSIEKNIRHIEPFKTSFKENEDSIDLNDTMSNDKMKIEKPDIPKLKFYEEKNNNQDSKISSSDSMDLDSREDSLDNCTQEVIDLSLIHI